MALADSAMRESVPDKRWVGRSFSRAATAYDSVAALQREVGEALLGRLPGVPFSPQAILDLGAGTGYCTVRLAQRFPVTDLFALDIAEGMLQACRQRPGVQDKALCICGDGEALPVRSRSVDLVCSNLALQWCPDVERVVAECARVLRPGGCLAFSTFGEATLGELRTAWARVDDRSHVNDFAPAAALADALRKAKFGEVAVHSIRKTVAYPSVEALLRELKSLGAHNITTNRPRQLTGKRAFGKMLEAYAAAMPPGRVEASFEVIYCQGRWRGLGKEQGG